MQFAKMVNDSVKKNSEDWKNKLVSNKLPDQNYPKVVPKGSYLYIVGNTLQLRHL